MSAADLRRVWRIAAWELLRRGRHADALEALANSLRRRPPGRWSSGQRLFEETR